MHLKKRRNDYMIFSMEYNVQNPFVYKVSFLRNVLHSQNLVYIIRYILRPRHHEPYLNIVS